MGLQHVSGGLPPDELRDTAGNERLASLISIGCKPIFRSMTHPPPVPHRELVTRLLPLALYVVRLTKAEGGPFEVSPSRMSLLRLLDERTELSVGDLAAHERVTSPTVVQTLRHLRRLGLVEQRKDPTDKRVTLVRISEDGRRTLAQDETTVSLALEKALAGVDERELRQLTKSVNVLFRRLSNS